MPAEASLAAVVQHMPTLLLRDMKKVSLCVITLCICCSQSLPVHACFALQSLQSFLSDLIMYLA